MITRLQNSSKKVFVAVLCTSLSLGAMDTEWTIDRAQETDPQTETYSKVLDIVTPYFFHGDIPTAIRSLLSLRQTCLAWFKKLDQATRRKITENYLFDGKTIDPNNRLGLSIQVQQSQILLKALRAINTEGDDLSPFEFPQTSFPELYLFAGATVNGHDEHGRSFMGLAAALQESKYLRMLIKKGGNIYIADLDDEGSDLITGKEAAQRFIMPGSYPKRDREYVVDGDGGEIVRKGKTPQYYAIEGKSEVNERLILQIPGVLSAFLRSAFYPNTSIVNAREALELIDTYVDASGEIHYSSDDE